MAEDLELVGRALRLAHGGLVRHPRLAERLARLLHRGGILIRLFLRFSALGLLLSAFF